MTGNQSQLVSVVTPFFNTAAYLTFCVESVLSQTHGNFEYILADNCSTDGSAEIAAGFAARDPRIRFVTHERHLPQIGNYNRALRLISPGSVYCKIVQADDHIAPRCLEELSAVAASEPRVGIVTSYYMNGSALKGTGLPYPTRCFSGQDVCRRQLLEDIFVFGSQTVPLFRSSIVRERVPFFSETALHPDTEVCYEILQSWDLGFVHQVLAYMRADNDSITSRIRSFNPYLLDKLIVIERFGKMYLSPQEYATVRRYYSGVYRRYLGRSWLRGREPAFWEHHRRGLASIGKTISKLALPWYAVTGVAEAVTNRLGSLWIPRIPRADPGSAPK